MTFLCFACGDVCKGYSGFYIRIEHIEPEMQSDPLLDYKHMLCGDCASLIIDLLEPADA
jgi:hypothetical protein